MSFVGQQQSGGLVQVSTQTLIQRTGQQWPPTHVFDMALQAPEVWEPAWPRSAGSYLAISLLRTWGQAVSNISRVTQEEP